MLVKPLPFEEPDRLVIAYNSYPKAGAERVGTSPAWHFTQAGGDRQKLERRVETQLGRDYRALRAQLREFNAAIELREEDWTRPRPRERRPRPEPAPFHEVFRRVRRGNDVPPAEE